MSEITKINTEIEIRDISPLICELRGQAVMLDRDLAELYHVMTGRLNEAVKRNLARFPPEFMFQLSDEEMKELIANCDRFKVMKHSPSRMYAFTEQGVAMLSAVLKSDIAIRESIRIMKAFVVMRRLLSASMPTLASLASRVEANERRQIEDQAKNERRFEEIHAKMSAGDIPLSHIFYDGQLWDARALVMKLVSGAKKSLVLIDNWATAETLDLFAKKRKGVKVTVFTSEHYDKKHMPHHKISDDDIKVFNAQYPKLTVCYNETFHDRFLIVDDKELYLIGASLKDLGKKCFGFTKMDAGEITRIKKAVFGVS